MSLFDISEDTIYNKFLSTVMSLETFMIRRQKVRRIIQRYGLEGYGHVKCISGSPVNLGFELWPPSEICTKDVGGYISFKETDLTSPPKTFLQRLGRSLFPTPFDKRISVYKNKIDAIRQHTW